MRDWTCWVALNSFAISVFFLEIMKRQQFHLTAPGHPQDRHSGTQMLSGPPREVKKWLKLPVI